MRSLRTYAVWTLVLTLAASAVAFGQTEEPGTVESAMPSAAFGFDIYAGTSNLVDNHRITDGMWAANGQYYPSVVYLQWNNPSGTSGKVSLGIGDLYTDSETTLDQPVEAYLQMPVGSTTLTVGKYWIPFAQQEWFYESKPGVMAQWENKGLSVSASFNYDQDYHRSKFYTRVGYTLSDNLDFGLSYAKGTGFCSDSIHDTGFAADTTVGFAGFRFYGEYNYFDADQPGNTLNYISGKLYYENLGKFTPFVGRFSWKDYSDFFGNFRSTVYGVEYQSSPTTCFEGAIADTGDDTITWLQVHWNWEKPFKPLWK